MYPGLRIHTSLLFEVYFIAGLVAGWGVFAFGAETVGLIPSTSQEGRKVFFVLLLQNENKFCMLIVCGPVGKTEDGL